MNELPGAGFSVPGGGGPNRPRRWWLLGVLVVAGVAVLIAGVVVAAVAIGANRQQPPSQVAAPSSSAPPPSAADIPRPVSAPGGDAAADQALWDALRGDGVQWSKCSYESPESAGARSYLLCQTLSPELTGLNFLAFSSAGEVTTAMDNYAASVTGDPGTCDVGGKSRGPVLGRDVACGYFAHDDGSRSYVITWTEPGRTVVAQTIDVDPARAWQWFQSYDPF